MDAKLAKAGEQLAQLKAAVARSDTAKASSLLSSLKIAMIEFPAMPPLCQPSPTSKQELQLARDVLETAVLLSVKLRDETAFERNFQQLKPFYTDIRDSLPPSPEEPHLTGLNLLRLLVQSRIAEFHVELELLPPATQRNPYIRHAIELEQGLMEGASQKLLELAAGKAVPAATYGYFMEKLMHTVKDEQASCAEKAYLSLSAKDARKVLMLNSDAELSTLVAQRGWELRDGTVWFGQRIKPPPSAADIPAMQLIKQTLGYAHEVDRIV